MQNGEKVAAKDAILRKKTQQKKEVAKVKVTTKNLRQGRKAPSVLSVRTRTDKIKSVTDMHGRFGKNMVAQMLCGFVVDPGSVSDERRQIRRQHEMPIKQHGACQNTHHRKRIGQSRRKPKSIPASRDGLSIRLHRISQKTFYTSFFLINCLSILIIAVFKF